MTYEVKIKLLVWNSFRLCCQFHELKCVLLCSVQYSTLACPPNISSVNYVSSSAICNLFQSFLVMSKEQYLWEQKRMRLLSPHRRNRGKVNSSHGFVRRSSFQDLPLQVKYWLQCVFRGHLVLCGAECIDGDAPKHVYPMSVRTQCISQSTH